MNCAFCATGKMGLIRNLDYLEIIEQVLFFTRLLRRSNPHNDTNQTTPDVVQTRVTNVTFMGMGEPFLNYDNVFKAIEILNNKDYFGISIRNISVSTCGVIEGIEKLADSGLQVNPHTKRAGNASVEGTWNNARSGVGVNLAISLHAPNNELRGKLMPVNKKYPLEKVLTAVDEYIKKTKRKVMFEYVLIKDVNDTDECAKQLAKLMKKKLYFLNLILYNDTGVFKASETKRVQAFKNILAKERINFVQRYRFGDDIKAACGQFATQSKG
jgi:23S rRNA (adenine2503-C2)-methyltransferase